MQPTTRTSSKLCIFTNKRWGRRPWLRSRKIWKMTRRIWSGSKPVLSMVWGWNLEPSTKWLIICWFQSHISNITISTFWKWQKRHFGTIKFKNRRNWWKSWVLILTIKTDFWGQGYSPSRKSNWWKWWNTAFSSGPRKICKSSAGKSGKMPLRIGGIRIRRRPRRSWYKTRRQSCRKIWHPPKIS